MTDNNSYAYPDECYPSNVKLVYCSYIAFYLIKI